MRIIDSGNFTRPIRIGLFVVGALLIYLPTQYVRSPIAWGICFFVGLLLMALGGFTSWANTLGLKPFDNSYKQARQTYQAKDDNQGNQNE